MKTTHTAKFILKHRRRLGLSQAVIAACIPCSVVFISRIEAGVCLLPPEHAEKLARIFKIPKDEVIAVLRMDMREKVEQKLGS